MKTTSETYVKSISSKTVSKGPPKYRLGRNFDRKISVALKGFDSSNYLEAKSVAEFIGVTVPPEHLIGLKSIELKCRNLPNTIAHFFSERVLMPYLGRSFYSNRIEVYQFKSLGDFYWSICHEIGHHIFQCHLPYCKKQEWIKSIHPLEGKVTEYANTSPFEDFAESYAAYLLTPEMLKMTGVRIEFLSDFCRRISRKYRRVVLSV